MQLTFRVAAFTKERMQPKSGRLSSYCRIPRHCCGEISISQYSKALQKGVSFEKVCCKNSCLVLCYRCFVNPVVVRCLWPTERSDSPHSIQLHQFCASCRRSKLCRSGLWLHREANHQWRS